MALISPKDCPICGKPVLWISPVIDAGYYRVGRTVEPFREFRLGCGHIVTDPLFDDTTQTYPIR